MQRRRFLQVAAIAAAANAAGSHRSLAALADVPCRLVVAPLFPHATFLAIHGEPGMTRDALTTIPAAKRKPAARLGPLPAAFRTIELLLEQLPQEKGATLQWMLDSQPLSSARPIVLKKGVRYRLRIINATGQSHPVHLQDHSFQLARMEESPVTAAITSTVYLDRYSVVDADVVA